MEPLVLVEDVKTPSHTLLSLSNLVSARGEAPSNTDVNADLPFFFTSQMRAVRVLTLMVVVLQRLRVHGRLQALVVRLIGLLPIIMQKSLEKGRRRMILLSF